TASTTAITANVLPRITCLQAPQAKEGRRSQAARCSGILRIPRGYLAAASVLQRGPRTMPTPADDKRLFLLDAFALIYRAYFSFIRAPRVNSKGFNTSAAFGFTTTLLDLIKREQPTHIAVVFDTAAPTERHEALLDYKANRE